MPAQTPSNDPAPVKAAVGAEQPCEAGKCPCTYRVPVGADKDQCQPQPGDYTFCARCYALLRFSKFGPYFATTADVTEMPLDTARAALLVLEAIAGRPVPPLIRK